MKTTLLRLILAFFFASTLLVIGAHMPRGIRITAESKSRVDADISNVHLKDIPTLTNIQALYMVYFTGDGATDEKLKALAQLRLTNLTGVVFTDCPLVTDAGIEYLSHIPTLEQFGLRHMAIGDSACEIMATKMRLLMVNMPGCTNVTVSGLMKLVQAKTIESLGFSLGKMSQDELIRLISTAAPELGQMTIEMDAVAEARLDLSAIRSAAKAKKIRVSAQRNRLVTPL